MKNKEGMTLVEVLVALVIFLFVSLAMMQTALVSIDANTNTALREEAIKIAEQRMNDARTQAFNSSIDTLSTPSLNPFQLPSTQKQTGAMDTSGLSASDCPSAKFLSDFPAGWACKRTVRSIQNFSFCTNSTVQPTQSYAVVTITVGWQWKGTDYRHAISTVIKRVML